MQSLPTFGEAGDVDWLVGLPLALGSVAGACLASLLAAQRWAGIWVYRILVLGVIGAIVQCVVLDTREFLRPSPIASRERGEKSPLRPVGRRLKA